MIIPINKLINLKLSSFMKKLLSIFINIGIQIYSKTQQQNTI
jgi:hypothetical protein